MAIALCAHPMTDPRSSPYTVISRNSTSNRRISFKSPVSQASLASPLRVLPPEPGPDWVTCINFVLGRSWMFSRRSWYVYSTSSSGPQDFSSSGLFSLVLRSSWPSSPWPQFQYGKRLEPYDPHRTIASIRHPEESVVQQPSEPNLTKAYFLFPNSVSWLVVIIFSILEFRWRHGTTLHTLCPRLTIVSKSNDMTVKAFISGLLGLIFNVDR